MNTEFLPVPPVKGGAVEEWIEKIAQHLKGSQVFVFSIFDEQLKREEQKGHIHYFRFKPGILARLLLCTYRLPFKQSYSFLFYLPYSFWCALRLKRIQPDIIHIHNRPHFVWIVRRLNPQAKVVLHIHQMSVIEEEKIWTKDLLDKVDLFLGCSQFIANELKKRYPRVAHKVHHIYNALDINHFPPVETQGERRQGMRQKLNMNGQNVVLYIGRLAENKGVHLLIDAVKKIIQAGQGNLKLVICGARGYSNREVTPYIQGLYDSAADIKDHILFAGYVPHKEITDYYLASDIVVIPSEVAEGFCLITIESMAAGIPVIACARGGIPEIIKDRETGLLVEEPTEDNFRKRIEEFLANPSLISNYAQNGRKLVEQHFTWEKVGRDLEGIYQRLLGNLSVNNQN